MCSDQRCEETAVQADEAGKVPVSYRSCSVAEVGFAPDVIVDDDTSKRNMVLAIQ